MNPPECRRRGEDGRFAHIETIFALFAFFCG